MFRVQRFSSKAEAQKCSVEAIARKGTVADGDAGISSPAEAVQLLFTARAEPDQSPTAGSSEPMSAGFDQRGSRQIIMSVRSLFRPRSVE